MKITGRELRKGISILISITYLLIMFNFVTDEVGMTLIMKILAIIPGILLLIYGLFIEMVDNEDIKKMETGEVTKSPIKYYFRMESQHSPLKKDS